MFEALGQNLLEHASFHTRARIAGLLILAAYTMLIYSLTSNVWLGATFDIISGLSVIGIVILMFPMFRAAGESQLNNAFLLCRSIEGLLMLIAGFCLMRASTAGYRAFIYESIHVYFFVAGALLFYLLLYRTRFVPEFISLWGFAATVVLLAVTLIKLTGFENAWLDVLLLSLIVNEVFLAFWLMVKGISVQPIEK